MNQMKKLASLLLALVMILSLSATALATGTTTGSITVDNPVKDATYTAYKIFDVVYNEGKDKYSYTIDSSTNEWYSTVNAYAATENSGLTLEQVTGTTTYIVKKTNDFSAADFAKALNDAKDGKTGEGLASETVSGKDVMKKASLPLGYYFVASSSGALCNLTTTNPDVTIHDKNNVTITKTDDKGPADESVQVGEYVNYTITGKVPDASQFTTYTYKITDTMSSGLTFEQPVTVKIDNVDVTTTCTVKYSPDAADSADFEIIIPVKENYQNQIGKDITVTYKAKVNENAVTAVQNNTAKLTYSNNPTTGSTNTIEVQEEVYSTKIVIDKFEGNSTDPDAQPTTGSTRLAGATFILYKKETPTGGGDPVTKYYKYTTGAAANVEWVDSKDDATSVTTKTAEEGILGSAEFKGLKSGTYYLLETAAPAGYNPVKDPIEVTITGAQATTGVAQTVTKSVANFSGAELPGTGGMGTTIFYVVGSVLLVGAAVLLITKKRMSAQQ